MFSIKKVNLLFASIFITFISTSCASNKQIAAPAQKKPDWVYNYNNGNGKICGVGSAGQHVKGRAAQVEMAASRAIDAIARQQELLVSTQLVATMKGSSKGGTSSNMSTASVQTSKDQIVDAEVKNSWMDERANRYYILMCTK